jgi:hypothetical protein
MILGTGDNPIPVTAEFRPLPHHVAGLAYTRSGYGAKIPTPYMVSLGGRFRRVYSTVYSNMGTCWILVNGKKEIVW